ncbi:MAG: cell division protein ZipA C-terminal FtsZ-binding domain-containing protein [Casimicrobiaceae bacterium]
MSSLQLGLIVAGILLVLAVVIYNHWQERQVRRRIAAAFRRSDDEPETLDTAAPEVRVEPTLRTSPARDGISDGAATLAAEPPPGATAVYRPGLSGDDESSLSPPWTASGAPLPPAARDESIDAAMARPAIARARESAGSATREPDPDIESIVTLQPAIPTGVGALAAGLHARFGKRLRWFGRAKRDGPWQLLATETRGEFVEFVACLLLADRNGAASRAQLETFVRVVGELAPLLPAAMAVPDVTAEVERAETLDRMCAEVDVQIGLTVLKADAGSIPGTRLRGVAEAAGFKLSSGGRFEWHQDETGTVLYSMQNLRNEPFTVDTLRLSATNGVVFVLDVPRVADPPRTFDQMKLAAKRMAHTLSADLVDDNRRPLDDPALAAIREQVQSASGALTHYGIEPGSPRAIALFGA